MSKANLILRGVAASIIAKADIGQVWLLPMMLGAQSFLLVCIFVLRRVWSLIIPEHQIRFSHLLWVFHSGPFWLLLVVGIIIGGGKISEGITTKVNMRLFMVEGLCFFQLLLHEIILIVGFKSSVIIAENKVFICMNFLEFWGVLSIPDLMFRISPLEFWFVICLTIRIGDSKIIRSCIGSWVGFMILWILPIPLNILWLTTSIIYTLFRCYFRSQMGSEHFEVRSPVLFFFQTKPWYKLQIL